MTTAGDRIVLPIGFENRAHSNPIYAERTTRSPSLVLVADTVASAGQYLDLTGGAYDPVRVVAIVDIVSVNAATQRLGGIDVAFTHANTLQLPGQFASMIDTNRWVASSLLKRSRGNRGQGLQKIL